MPELAANLKAKSNTEKFKIEDCRLQIEGSTLLPAAWSRTEIPQSSI
jgi:hypothetical protein